MKDRLLYFPVSLMGFLFVLQIFCPGSFAQQRPDTAFTYLIETPAYPPGTGPLLAIDDAHHNFHTLDGGFAPFGKLVRLDGYRVQRMNSPLNTLKTGTGPRILVIANALDVSDTEDWVLPNPSAFNKEEIQNIQRWVAEGGRLLLIADHMPFAGAAGELAAAFGFSFLNGFAFTAERSWPPSKFTKVEGTLCSSPVTETGKAQSNVNEVATFTGSAFTIPDQAIPVLKFNRDHWSLQPDTAWVFHLGTPKVMLENHCQGAIMKYGKGKIAVFGEAAMFTAQIVNENFRVGINSPEAPDNARFALNLIHWLDDFAQQVTGASDSQSQRLQFILDSLTGNGVIPGITFAARFHDGRKLSLASGFSDKEEHTMMIPDAVMFSGSVGKTYVAALVLMLQEKGMLSIREKAGKYLGDEAWFAGIPNSGEMTIEMLLNHTAGVPEYVYDRAIWEGLRQQPDKRWSVAERLSFISGHSPSNPAGKSWSYADSHYIILGAVIEKVTKRNYYDVLNDMILQPFQLKNTRPAIGRAVPGLPAGYTSLSDELLLPEKVTAKSIYAFNPQLEWTGGGLVSTVSDLCLWASQLYSGQVIEKKSLSMMLTPVPFKTTLVENAGYGLGCFIGEHQGVRYFGHTGFVPGYITVLHYLPDRNISMAMQFNSDKLHGQEATRVFNLLKSTLLTP